MDDDLDRQGEVVTGYRLGIDLGTTFTSAAVNTGGWPTIVGLGNRAMQIPSVLFLKTDGEFLVGEAAERRGNAEPSRVTREFKRRLGDRVPILIAGAPYSAETLQSVLLSWVVHEVSQRQGAPPDHITVTCPANWGPFKRELFDQTIRLADIGPVQVITEPEAVAILYAARNTLQPGQSVAVYDLGGGTFDAAVLAKTETGVRFLGPPEGLEQLGGIDFDEALFQHALATLRGQLRDRLPEPDARVDESVLARLRRDCVEAKEALSSDTETDVSVVLPTLSTTITVTRADLEAMIGPTIADTVSAMNRAIRSAGLQSANLSAIVLSGGSSRIPLVSQLLHHAFRRPLALDSHPKHDVALGATLVGAQAGIGFGSGRSAPDPATGPVAIAPHRVGPPARPAEQLVFPGAMDTQRKPSRVRRRVFVAGALFVLAALGAGLALLIAGHGGGTRSVAQLGTDTMLVTGTQDGAVTFYAIDVGSGHRTTISLNSPRAAGLEAFLPTISPDRKHFVYQVGPPSVRYEQGPSVPWIANIDGVARPLFTDRSPCQASNPPTFSPNGKELAVVCPGTGSGVLGLYVIGIDGSLHRQLLLGQGVVGTAAWTGDDSIVFERTGDQGQVALWSISSKGGTPVNITSNTSGRDTNPSWTAGGGVLFDQSDTQGQTSFAVIQPERSVRTISQSADLDWPCWSPDGARIAFLTSDTPPRLMTMKADGTDKHAVPWPSPAAVPGPPAWASR